jgi:cyclohexyl-isocyanide hydratase
MNTPPVPRRDMIRQLACGAAAATLVPRLLGAATAPSVKETGAALHAHPQPQLQMGTEQVAILVYPEFTALDALGPYYALAGMMGATVRFVAKSLEPVPCEGGSKSGLFVKPHWSFADCPRDLDLLLVPGGLVGTLAAMEDPATLGFLRARAKTTRLVASVCTGSLVLGAAGLLKGRRATTHWQLMEALTAAGATPVAQRIVFDGADRVTAAGVSAGIDLGLELVRRYRGDLYAKGMQLLGEYDPQPPFPGGGNPKTADQVAVDMLNTMHAPLVPRFRDAIARALSEAPTGKANGQ